MDGVKIKPLLPKKWLMKSLMWQQNHHQKVFYRGSLHMCSGTWHSEIWRKITVL